MFTRLTHFDHCRNTARPQDAIDRIRTAAEGFRRDFMAGGQVRGYRSMELVRVPYPSKYAYLNGFAWLPPFVQLCNRVFIIQFDSAEGRKTLLAGPSDWEHQRSTPFFARLDARMGPLAGLGEQLMVRKTRTVLQALAEAGLQPEDVDYITYDHLHTQNLTRWLGAHGQPALLPNARLLVMREEWESAQGLVPWQAQWYCPGGTAGIPADRVILLDHDVQLGAGVALVRTRGHTLGNHSIVAHTPDGVLVTSENGVSLDAYAPEHSRVRGVAAYARETGSEVILNGNTLEYGVDQYLSMIQERAMAGPSPHDPRFPNVVPSSETVPFWLSPGTAPTAQIGERQYGRLQRPDHRSALSQAA